MSVFSGDFLGVTLGELHSSQLNITRVSAGDRYEDNLIPNLVDTTVEVPGGDGTYYWDTFYRQKPFTLNFAYDNLRDEDLRKLRQILGFKGVQPLIFDEMPYKKYMVKSSAPPNFKYICFDDKEMKLYKGEATVTLVAYYPFALATFSPGLFNTKSGIINNVGDLPGHLTIRYKINSLPTEIRLYDLDDNELAFITFNTMNKQKNNDEYVLINMYTHLIEGLDNKLNKTGSLYNKFIATGDMFEAPMGRTKLVSDSTFIKAEYTPLYY